MFTTLITTVALLVALMAAWIEVQRAARRVAAQHPESGPLRLVGGGCGGQGHGDDHGHDAALVPNPKRVAATSGSATAPAEGCAACANTACKPGALAADGAAFHPMCSD
jgi:hypothetical protein